MVWICLPYFIVIPGSAEPSQKDIELAFYDVYHIIVAIEPKFEVKCFKIENRKFDEQELFIE